MTGDIVKRLRLYAAAEVIHAPLNGGGFDVARAAADAIEELRAERDASRLTISDLTAEVERLRALITEWDATCEALRRPPRQWSEGDWHDAEVRLGAAVNALIEEARRG